MALSQGQIDEAVTVVSPYFDRDYYLRTYPDVREAGVDPVVHYITSGWLENRNPSAAFDTGYYLERYPDIRASGDIPLVHFARFGAQEGRVTCRPPAPAEGAAPAEGGLSSMAAPDPADLALVREHMDAAFYISVYPEAAGQDPALHYCTQGWRQGHDPQPGFSTSFYLRHNSDVREQGVNPFAHYLRHGATERSRPTASVATAAIAERLEAEPFRTYLAAAKRIDPMVGLPRTPRIVTSRRDQRRNLLKVARELRLEFHGRTFPVCIALPQGDAGEVFRAAAALVTACAGIYGPANVLVLTTDSGPGTIADALPVNVRVFDLSGLLTGLEAAERRTALLDLVRGVGVSYLINLESRLCWDLLRDYHRQCCDEMRVLPYVLTGVSGPEGAGTGYIIDGVHEVVDSVDHILTDCEFTANQIRDRYGLSHGRDKVSVLYTPVRVRESTPQRMASHGARLRAIWAGSVENEVQPSRLTALARLRPDVDFHVLGMPGTALRPGNIVFSGGWQLTGEIPEQPFDFCITTGEDDGLPPMLVEAASRGIPVVAPGRGGAAELIDSTTGWLASPPEDVASYATSIGALLNNPSECAQRTRALRQRLELWFSVDEYQARLAKVIGS